MTSPVMAWFAVRSAGAPAALQERARAYLESRVGKEPGPAALADAGRQALRHTVASRGDRSVALDLLAADALVTLALLAQADEDPAGLVAFARQLLRDGAARP